jgi:hypothetical protein
MTGQGMSGIVRAGGAPVPREPAPAAAERPGQQLDPPDAVPSAEESLGPADAPLPAPLPPGAALLRVLRQSHEGEDCFYLELQSDVQIRGTAEQVLPNQRRPDITLASAVTKQKWRESLLELRSWSVNKVTLRQWLTALRRKHGRRLRLIIWDETDFQIPWELFFHETGDPDSRGWLGATVEVIRWTTVYSENRHDWSTGGPGTCQGPILGFIQPGFPAPVRLLSRYVHEAAGSMQDLLGKLDDVHKEVGLAYVWGHGILGSNGGVATIAGMSMDEVGAKLMRALHGFRTLVLLNACGSAQLMNDDRFAEKATRSFAEIFLRHGARGVIATTGQVGKGESHQFMQELLFGAEEGINLPDTLLKYRASLASDLPADSEDDEDAQDRREAFFHGFLFLYFGNPDTELRMLPVEVGA